MNTQPPTYATTKKVFNHKKILSSCQLSTRAIRIQRLQNNHRCRSAIVIAAAATSSVPTIKTIACAYVALVANKTQSYPYCRVLTPVLNIKNNSPSLCKRLSSHIENCHLNSLISDKQFVKVQKQFYRDYSSVSLGVPLKSCEAPLLGDICEKYRSILQRTSADLVSHKDSDNQNSSNALGYKNINCRTRQAIHQKPSRL